MVDPCCEGHKWEVPYIVLPNNMGLTNIRNIKRVLKEKPPPIMPSSYLIAHSLTFYLYEVSISLKYVFGTSDFKVSNIPLLKMDKANLIIDRINHMFKMNFHYYSKDIEFYKFYSDLKYNEMGLNVDIDTNIISNVEGEWYQNF